MSTKDYKRLSSLSILTSSWLVVAFLQLVTVSLSAQAWSTYPRHFTVDDGLPTLDVYHIQQDKDGFIWIGTDVGMARYDGYDFEVTTTRDGLPNNDVIRIVEDQQGKLWVSSFGPLCIINDGEKEIIDLPELQVRKTIFEIINSAEDGMWMNYGRDIFYLDASYQLKPLPESIAKPRTYSRQAMTKGEQDTVLIYSGDYIYHTYNESVVDSILLPSVFRDVLGIVYAYHDGAYFFITDNGLQEWNPQKAEIKLIDGDIKNGIKMNVEGDQLFAMHSNYGLRIYEQEDDSWELKHQLYASDYCNSYMLDREGNLWITTLGNGMYFYPRQTIPSYATVLPEEHQRLNKLLGNNNSLYLGTYNGRIYTFNPEDHSASMLVESKAPSNDIFDRIMSMVSLSTGELLIGKDTGLYLLEGDSLKYLVKLAIKSLYVDKDDGLLINTQGSCMHVPRTLLEEWRESLEGEHKNVMKKAKLIAEGRGYTSFVSKDGTIWTDNTARGLISYRDGMTTYWQDRSQIFKVQVNDIEELPDGTLALATQGEGLVFLKNGDFWVVDELLQLPSTIVSSLYLSGDSLWVATNRGVALASGIDISRRQVTVNVYNRNDGLLTEDIADVVVWQDELILATERGLLRLPLEQGPEEEVYPRVLIQSLKVDGMDLMVGDNIELSNHSNNPSFSFLGISYRSQGKIRYRYRLEGYDQDWLNTANREVNYHNLSPGAYTFMVQAIDYKGQFSENIASLPFYIRPHFTQRRGFWFLLSILVLGLLGAAGYSYLSIRQKNILTLLVKEKTADLDQQVAELARSNEELEQFARAASHDLKSPLRNVASFVQLLDRRANDRLSKDEKEYIQLAVNGVKSMERTIEDLLRVTKVDQHDIEKVSLNFIRVIKEIEQANQNLLKEQQAEIIIDNEFPEITFSKVNAYQLFQNLILNSINYRSEEAPRIHVGCEEAGSFWRFYVKDNGIGIEEEFQEQIFSLFQRLHHNDEIPGTGIGLALCKKIVERNGGKISVDSMPGHGATFYFTIPKE
ncbi:ATP-binding protein [Lewinella cohaerens]|uniref:ATP-binding protein n=1 Tax=Lewinella cohaerens TaxID=70995 RepID=UPI000370A982|nr:ATP-binding protein [Lewinella cohaerens]